MLVILNGLARGDSISASFFQNRIGNLFQNVYAEEDYLSSLSLVLDKSLGKFSLYTEGQLAYFYRNPDMTFYTHELGLDYLLPFGEKTALYASLSGRGTFYRQDFNDFNYVALNFFGALKTYLSPTSILKSQYTLAYRTYRYSFFDFLQHLLQLSVDKYFSTKTTLKIELDWGYKYYFNPYSLEETTPDLFPSSGGFSQGNMKGRGNGYGKGNSPPAYIQSSPHAHEGVQIFSAGGWLAQGFGPAVGLRFSGLKQWTISGKSPFALIEEYYWVENPSYDRFSWNGHQMAGMLTALLPWDIQFKLSYTVSKKEFPGIESLDLEGLPLGLTREDKRRQVEGRMEKDFSRFSLYFSYIYVKNFSNDPLYDWNGFYISLGMGWNAPLGGKR